MINQDYIMKIRDLWSKCKPYLKKPGVVILLGVIICGIIVDSLYASAFFGSVLYLFILFNRRTDIKIAEQKMQEFDKDTPDIIDHIIDEAFNEYLVLNRGYKRADEAITSDEELEMVNRMIDMVSARISKPIQAKLEAYYDKDSVPSILSSKVYMAVMAYVITQNQPKDDLPRTRVQTTGGMTDITKYL